MGGGGNRKPRIHRDHVLTEAEVLRYLGGHPGSTSIEIENGMQGTRGYQLLLDLQAKGKVHQTGYGLGTGTRKYPPAWALGPGPKV